MICSPTPPSTWTLLWRTNVDLIKTIEPRFHEGLARRIATLEGEAAFDQAALQAALRDEYQSSGYNVRRLTRDQTSKLVGQLNHARQTEVGIDRYRWLTSQDERVRPSHINNSGQIFSWADPPADTGHPGEDVMCRCVAVPVFSPAVAPGGPASPDCDTVGAMAADATTRQRTPEGMLRAGAVLTRSGDFEYQRKELGLDGDGSAVVHRTLESIAHPDTLASLRGAPITLGHPDGGVTPDNFQQVVVGAVAGEPQVQGGVVVGDVLIGDSDALRRLNAGTEELSIGYDFVLTDDLRTYGALGINHVALVERGRAGSSVRVLDHVSSEGERMTDEMKAAVQAAVVVAVKDAMPGHETSGVATAITAAVSPLVDKVNQLAADAAATKKATDEATAKAAATAAATKLVDATRAEERERFAVLTDAMPLIPEADRGKLAASDVKTILATALKDVVPDAANQDVAYLRGALAMTKRAAATAANGAGLPNGVTAADQTTFISGAVDKRQKAMDEFMAAQTKAYADGGGV